MAQPSTFLIEALRKTADKLAKGAPYQWGHMGSCNCGNLAQEITQLSKAKIHEYALQTRFGDWSEQTSEFCPTSNLPMDIVISEMLNAGLTRTDLKHLEKLSDKQVLKRLPANNRYLMHNKRDDVVKYLRTWADLLEEQLLEKINIKNVVVPAKVLV
ncbi:aldo-keto reductase family protein [Microscilla marina]|uniref:Uncharacterized protein n=1 Tax=Microscilla marina ATCC 23134 TaxID=313606 RepID=A1ZG93_MICM2|nr:hypothetical protein [Microscilla marina]EAY30510.1 hypothetical protein M23134_03146 [Microscilla marina ATCC 23134]